MNWVDTGRFLVIAGTVIVLVGVFFLFADKLPLGRLPGDIRLGTGRTRVFIPITTCILLSALITLVLNFFSKK